MQSSLPQFIAMQILPLGPLILTIAHSRHHSRRSRVAHARAHTVRAHHAPAGFFFAAGFFFVAVVFFTAVARLVAGFLADFLAAGFFFVAGLFAAGFFATMVIEWSGVR